MGKWESLGVHAFSCLFIIYFGSWIQIVQFSTIKSFNPMRCQTHWHDQPKNGFNKKIHYLTNNSQFFKSTYQPNWGIFYSNIYTIMILFICIPWQKNSISSLKDKKTGSSHIKKLVFRSVFLLWKVFDLPLSLRKPEDSLPHDTAHWTIFLLLFATIKHIKKTIAKRPTMGNNISRQIPQSWIIFLALI